MIKLERLKSRELEDKGKFTSAFGVNGAATRTIKMFCEAHVS
jgi:hypothetical protein